MTIRRTTALVLGILLGNSVAALMIWASPPPLGLVRLRDDFSGRMLMQDDPNEPAPQEEVVIFFPPASRVEEPIREPEPLPPAARKPARPLDPLEMPRSQAGAYDRIPSK